MKTDETDAFAAQVRVVQIIVGALAGGVMMFGVLAMTVLNPEARPPGPNEATIMGLPLMTAVALLFGALTLAASLVVPRFVVDAELRRMAAAPPSEDDSRRLPQLYQTQLIIASALNEGGAFFGLIAYLMEGRLVAVAVAGLLLAVLLSRFPTPERVRGWLDIQRDRLAHLRRDGA